MALPTNGHVEYAGCKGEGLLLCPQAMAHCGQLALGQASWSQRVIEEQAMALILAVLCGCYCCAAAVQEILHLGAHSV